MTNITTLIPSEKKDLKPIKAVKFMEGSGDIIELDPNYSLNIWDNVKLLCLNYGSYEEKYDLFFAWDDDGDSSCLFLGHWNDGIVKER